MTPHELALKAQSEMGLHGAALDVLRQRATEQLFASQAGQADYREALYRTVQTIDAVRDYLKAIIAGGEIEDHVRQMLEPAPRA